MLTLGLWRYAIYAAIVAVAIGGLAYAKHQYDEKQQAIGAAPYIMAIEKQKQEAAILLQAETERANKITQAWLDDARKSEDDYQKKIAAIRATANASNGLRLLDPQRWYSSSCPNADGDDPGAFKETARRNELLRTTDTFLYSEAARADEIVEWAKSCHAFVNRPTMKSQVKAIP